MISMSESTEQILVIDYLNSITPRPLFTVAKVGRSAGRGVNARFKHLGYRPGTPDIMVFVARGVYHGLFIEFKPAIGGIQSPVQKEFMADSLTAGYAYELCHGAPRAIEIIQHYLASQYPMAPLLKVHVAPPKKLFEPMTSIEHYLASRDIPSDQELKDSLAPLDN